MPTCKSVSILFPLVVVIAGCRTDPPPHTAIPSTSSARPAVIPAGGGEERVLRGGAASLFIKVDPISTGSETLMVGYSDLSPGDAIGVHRHLREDEVMVITRRHCGAFRPRRASR